MLVSRSSAKRIQIQIFSRDIADFALLETDVCVLHDTTDDRRKDLLSNYALLLRFHGNTRALSLGMVTHDHLIRNKLDVDVFLSNLVVQMYGRCGALEEARSVLAQMHQHDVFGWTFIISAYAHAGQGSDAMRFVNQMQHEAAMPSSFTIVESLCACGKENLLIEGKHLHASIAASSSAAGVIVENALLNFYGKCCHLRAVQKVFVQMVEKDVVSWNTVLTAYNQNGEQSAAHQLFQAMLQQGHLPDKVTYSCLCDACISKDDLNKSRRFHSCIMGCSREDVGVNIGNSIICMYARCGSLKNAFTAFYEIGEPNVVSWTTLISALAQQKLCKEAVMLSQRMFLEGVLPNSVTFLSLISACSSQEDLTNGMQLHAQVISLGYESNISIGNALINLYGKCRNLKMARIIFDEMPTHDQVSWNSLIAAYSLQEHCKEALVLFGKMHQGLVKLDRVTMVSILQSISSEQDLGEGKLLHAYIYEIWDGLDSIVGSILITMYAKCGTLEDMHAVFGQVPDRSLVVWTALISAYNEHGQNHQANQIFEHMKLDGFIPDELAFSMALSACHGQQDLVRGKCIHASILGFRTSTIPVVSNALLGMYVNCGSLRDAENAFKKLFSRNLVSWNTIINACVQNGQPKRAFVYFKQMLVDGVLPNMSTYASLLSACALLATLTEGRQIHELLLVAGIEPDVVLGTALVNLYGKCGAVEDAERVFQRMPKRNAAAWNSIIATFCQIGDNDGARTLFSQLLDDGVRPDETTFLTIVSSCSHAGRVDEAIDYFISMDRDYGVMPTVEHYNCLIDLFGRAGCLDKVEDILAQVSFEPDLHSWMSSLSACRARVDVERGECIMKSLSKLQITTHSPQVLMSNIYAAAGRFEAASLMRSRDRD